MGFRNPITSAAAVDTGQPAGAGARLYETSDATGVYGLLEFRDGIAGDVPAGVFGKANLTPQGGGGGYTLQGGGLAVRGGSYNGVTAPEWDLNVEPDPAGGYRPVARLSGAALLDLGIPLQTFSPTLTAPNGNPGLGTGGKLLGRTWRLGPLAWVQIYLFTGGQTGAAFNGGSGAWTFGGLPFPAETTSGVEQHIGLKAFTAAGNLAGFGLMIGAQVAPFLRITSSNDQLAQVTDAVGGAAGSGTPQIAGGYPFTNGHNLTVEGWYVAAP